MNQGATRLPTIVAQVGTPSQVERFGCSAISAIARAATSGW